MSETRLQNEIIDLYRKIDVWVIRTARSKKRGWKSINTGEDGQPDLWTELGWVEVKLPGKDLDPDQVAWHAKAVKRGVNVGTVWSVQDAFLLAMHWRQKRAAQT